MTSPYLPDDCIYYILNYLQPYHSTLFNCLLVNRFWCKAAVPLLYADPFYDCIPYFSSNKKHSSIIFTLISCLNKTEILQLKNQLKLKKINNIDINDDHKPLFEYLKYLENFDYFKINNTVLSWLDLSYLLLSFDQRESENVIPILHQSMLHQCNNIKQLNIPLYALYNCDVQIIKTISSNLAKLTSLMISLDLNKTDNETSAGFLNNIENICLNLRKFEISSHSSLINNNFSINSSDFRENLCTIIQKQNNLEMIKLSSYCQGFLNNIFLSLEFQKHSLVDIEFSFINFSNISFKNFINLCNLKYLKFRNCNGMWYDWYGTMVSLDKYEILKYVSFKLKRLEIIFSDSIIASLMIKYLGASLQELKFYEKLDISIIENISTYCLNLITLEIEVDQTIDLSVLSHFKNLRIRTLNINNIFYGLDHIDMDMIFKNLAKNLPINVKEVFFLSYKLSHFKGFLEDCHNFLEVIGVNCSVELILLKIIMNYIERSNDNLKCLGAIKLEKELDGEDLKLLNQIKSKGVKIVDFYSICKPVVY